MLIGNEVNGISHLKLGTFSPFLENIQPAFTRVLHHCTVVTIKGKSYRLKDRKKNSLPTMRRG
jgi:DNA replication protein DnaC